MTALRLATPADDNVLRALMRENDMPSWVDMAMEREPSFAAGIGWYGDEVAALAEDAGEVVGMYTLRVADMNVDGTPRRTGYLGGLRVTSTQRHRVRHLRAGFESVRRLAPGSVPACWFTVIAEGNTTARRLLEAGLSGFPSYRHLGNLITFAVSRSRGVPARRWRTASEQDVELMVRFHAAQASRLQLAPVLDHALIARLGLANFRVLDSASGLAAMACLWNQGAFRQIVARRYTPLASALRPAYNVVARLMRRPQLPRAGEALAQTFVAFLALHDELSADPRAARAALTGLLADCPTPVAALGLHEGHPLTPVVASLGPLTYRTRLYEVVFDGGAPVLGTGPFQPEVALL